MSASADERYRILSRLGAGGMGEVFLVEHLHLGRLEALKVLRPEVAAELHFVSRFRREARAQNRVQHPHIVSVYDFGRLPDGRFFLAMEYVEGVRVDVALAEGGPLPPRRALGILGQLARAVAFAHAHDVIHRDLKPANLLLTTHRADKDFLKVLDFGMAKIVSRDYSEAVPPTRKGEILGTPAYMSPDQLAGGAADPRGDIYAIGCIAYELLTGAPPFVGSTSEVIEQHMSREPEPPSRGRPQAGISRALDQLVLSCLSKRAKERLAGALELEAALRRLADEATARPPALTSAGDFEPGDTQERGFERTQDPVHDRTQALSEDDARPLAREARRHRAGRLIDAGRGHARLIVTLARARRAEDEVARVVAEIGEVRRAADRVEQRSRERQAPLAFAVGELAFEREGAEDAAARAQLEVEIVALETQLQALLRAGDAELRALDDRAIALASQHDDALAARDAIDAELEAVLRALVTPA